MRLLARVENPVQVHELWLEPAPDGYPAIVAVELSGQRRSERRIDLGTLVHLALNVTDAELGALAARTRDWQGQDTSGGSPDGCPHGPGAQSACNSCWAAAAATSAAR